MDNPYSLWKGCKVVDRGENSLEQEDGVVTRTFVETRVYLINCNFVFVILS